MPRIAQITFIATFLCVAVAAAPANPPTLADGQAAKVAGQIITVRDARFYLALQRFRDGKGDPLAPETPAELKSAVQRVLLEEMVYSELKSLKVEGGSRADTDQALKQRKKPPASKSWERILKQFNQTDAQAIDRVWKSQQVERFIQKRIETMTPIVTPAEIDRFLRQKSRAGDKKLDEAELERLRPGAAQELKKDLMRKELEEWIVLLKRKYAVTNYLEG